MKKEMSALKKEETLNRLVKGGGLSRGEANRIVYGWYEPKMSTFWDDLFQSYPENAPPLAQGEAFYLILKTSFGSDYSKSKKLKLEDAVFSEICHVLVRGILAGCVETKVRSEKNKTPEKLFQR